MLQGIWMTFYERIENQGMQTLAVWMFIELLARMCNVLRLGSEVCNWLPASYLKKKEYSLHSAFCTQPAFYSQSAVCILHSLCILPLVRSLQSAVRTLRFTLTGSVLSLWATVGRCTTFETGGLVHFQYRFYASEELDIRNVFHGDSLQSRCG